MASVCSTSHQGQDRSVTGKQGIYMESVGWVGANHAGSQVAGVSCALGSGSGVSANHITKVGQDVPFMGHPERMPCVAARLSSCPPHKTAALRTSRTGICTPGFVLSRGFEVFWRFLQNKNKTSLGGGRGRFPLFWAYFLPVSTRTGQHFRLSSRAEGDGD